MLIQLLENGLKLHLGKTTKLQRCLDVLSEVKDTDDDWGRGLGGGGAHGGLGGHQTQVSCIVGRFFTT